MIRQCSFFPRGKESAIIGTNIAGVPYISIIDDDPEKPKLHKRIKLYDFENADYPVPVAKQEAMIAKQLRRIGAKTNFYAELHKKFIPRTNIHDLAA